MPLQHIVAVTNDTDEGRAALQAATSLAQRLRSKVTVLTVTDVLLKGDALTQLTRNLRQSVTRHLETVRHPRPVIHFAFQSGLPAVEISRFAEVSDADLIVMGKKDLSLGPDGNADVCDAVARRSRVPCLFVSPGEVHFDHLLVALDGSERGLVVLNGAVDFARDASMRVRAVVVEPSAPLLDAPWVHTARTERIAGAVTHMEQIGALNPELPNLDHGNRTQPVLIRHGQVVEEILNEVAIESTDVLAFGCQRGGPTLETDPLSIPNRLLHHSTCAVLTIPL